MIRLPGQIFIATTAVDLRLSFDRLAGIVRNELGTEPRGESPWYSTIGAGLT
jgi:hypothetical protein